jgi:pimeloyl-ACP methyl ester carboxylesterase
MKLKTLFALLLLMVVAGTSVDRLAAQTSKPTAPTPKPSIVLVHGAFADGSGWSKVIPLLEKDGYMVTAVQNNMETYAADVANTRRVVDAQKGPVVLVGHSYGGAVITGAAVGAENVKALVYIAAFGPDQGEALQPLLEKYPSLISAALVPDAAGYLYIDRAKFKDAFAGDVTPTELSAMAAAQKPINSAIFGQVFDVPAWKKIPSWYLVATEDHAINPDLQRMFAKRMNATTQEVKSSHVPFMSNPKTVVSIIEAAAAGSQNAKM